MAGRELEDILQQAERLRADLDGGDELPRVQRNFQQLLDAGKRLRSGPTVSQDGAQIKASLLLSSQGYEIPQISDRLKNLTSAAQTLEPLEPICDTDVEGFLRNERENAILSVLEEQKNSTFEMVQEASWNSILSDWEKDKQDILGKLISSEGTLNFSTDFSKTSASNADYLNVTDTSNGRSMMDAWEVGYARQVYIYNEKIISGSIKPNFVDLCKITAEKMKDDNIAAIWKMVKFITDSKVATSYRSIVSKRLSGEIIVEVLDQAKKYLEVSYKDYMRKYVHSKLHAAKLGGSLSTVNLVESFLKVNPPDIPGCTDANWAKLYYCLRCGDLDAAKRIAGSVNAELPGWLDEFSTNKCLSPSLEHRLQLQYKRNDINSGDPFEAAIYSLLCRNESMQPHYNISEKTDDYLWLKLGQVQVQIERDRDSGQGALTLLGLQSNLAEFGEAHFEANANPLLYFEVLFLTYQFEAAIEFLARFPNLRCHAVHIALALHETDLLVKAGNLHDPLLSTKISDKNKLTNIQRINFPRLLMMYTKKFELTDPREALNYLYFLRDERHEGESLFMQCTSELIRETGDYALMLGGLNQDGSRRPGLVDRYCSGNTNELIAKVAKDTEDKGLFEDAVMLYDLCGKYDNGLRILNRLLSPLVSSADRAHSGRARLKDLALGLAHRYRTLSVELASDLQSTFYVLLDLLTFFDQYHAARYDSALEIISELHILPNKPEMVQEKVRAFSSYADEVRQNIGEVLLATMKMLAFRRNQLLATDFRGIEALKVHARALLTYTGMLPYQLPGDITSKLVQLEVDML